MKQNEWLWAGLGMALGGRMQDRAFVLVPLADVAPQWRHPRTGASVAEMLAALPAAERAAVRVWLDNPPPTDQVTGSALSDSNR